MLSEQRFYSLLADAILVVHFAFVVFVLLGFVVIWAGYLCRWAFVRDLRFRVLHLGAMGVVLAESLAGLICPLTTWENQLRVKAGQTAYSGSFVQHWLQRLLFHDWSEQTFIILYAVLFVLFVLTFWIVRPQPPRRPGASGPSE